ncbi:MAG: hypothetical protein OHK005_18440 [Candidatus Methylacidiphilales bacterium]
MPIRWKLLLLLATTATVPMAVVLGSVLWQFDRLGEELSTRSEQALMERARKQLMLLVETSSRLIRKERLIAEQALQIQADALGDAWGGRLRWKDRSPPPVYGPEPLQEPLPEGEPGFFIGQAADQARARAEVARLAAALPLLDRLLKESGPSLFRQYAALDSGLLLANPASDLAWQPNFDPRLRPWFRADGGQQRPGWKVTQTRLDREDLILSVFMPLVNDQGVRFGATGLDVRPGRVIKEALLPRSWRGHLRVLLVRCEANPPGLVVLAEQNEGEEEPAWQVELKAVPLVVGDHEELAVMIEGIRAGRSGVVEMSHDGEPALWAFAPSATDGDGLVVIIPQAVVIREARSIQDYVWNRVYVFVSGTLMVFFLLAALVVGASFWCSAAFTRPFHAIMDTVLKLAAGDFKARAEVRTRDERQTLADAVNALAPALEEHVEMKQSLQLADAVQRHLLPEEPLRTEGLEVAGAALYSAETGGDYFDYTWVEGAGGPAVGVAIGDVSGHGIGSALLMATGRALLRSEARHARDLGEAMAMVNDQLAADASSGQFLTLFCLSVVPETGHLRWASAGHDPALVFDPQRGVFRELAGGGLALGILPGWSYETFSGELAPGEWVVLATDGVWEARRADGEMFGKERLREAIRAGSEKDVEGMVQTILETVARFRGEEAQQDDITVVVMRRREVKG